MGQHPSKRRSFTPGQDANSEIPSSTAANGDVKSDVTANGGTVERRKPQEATSQTVVTSTSSTGKKESKRRKLKFVSFPIRRTPSGRWTRKRRSVKANGANTRPVSCPVPSLTEDSNTTPQRPQSLFLDEFEVHEEEGEGKVETVDLSDHEEGKTPKDNKDPSAPVPKPREKKAKRGSNKKQDGKKKKKEKKKDSKNDKEKDKAKSSSIEDTSADKADDKNGASEESQSATAAAAATTEQPGESPDLNVVAASIVKETVNNARQQLITEHNTSSADDTKSKDVGAENNAEAPTSSSAVTVEAEVTEVKENMEAPVTVTTSESFPQSTEEEDAWGIVEEQIVATKAPEKEHALPPSFFGPDDSSEKDHEETTAELPAKEGDTEAKEGDTDAKEGDTEAKEGKTDTKDSDMDTKDESTDLSLKFGADEAIAEKAKDEVEDLVLSSTELSEPAGPESPDLQTEVAEEVITIQKVDKVKTVPNFNFDTEIQAASNEKENDKETENKDVKEADDKDDKKISDETLDANVNAVADKVDEIKNDINDKEQSVDKEDNVVENETSKSEIVSHATDEVDAKISSAIGGATEEHIKDATDKNMEETPKGDDSGAQGTAPIAGPSTKDAGVSQEIVNMTPTNLEPEKTVKAKAMKEQKEKERVEKERLKKQKEQEKQKEKERVREEKRKKAEEKAAEKVKMRGDKKSLPHRISSWFKKERPKSVGATSPSTSAPANDTQSSPEPAAESSTSAATRESLSVDVSVQPMTRSGDNAKSSPGAGTSSPDSAPVSPAYSDSSAPVSPSSDDADKGPPGALKKINLGPRLRTAILRKKSSNASDSGQEDKRVSLTQPKSVETTELTPPPRKLRPRKPKDQYTPVTKGAHNPSRSQSPQLDKRETGESAAEDDQQKEAEESAASSVETKEITDVSDTGENVASPDSQSPQSENDGNGKLPDGEEIKQAVTPDVLSSSNEIKELEENASDKVAQIASESQIAKVEEEGNIDIPAKEVDETVGELSPLSNAIDQVQNKADHAEAVTSVKTEEAVTSVKTEEAVTSVKTEEAVTSVKTEEAVTSVKTEEAVTSVKTEEAVTSVKTEEAVSEETAAIASVVEETADGKDDEASAAPKDMVDDVTSTSSLSQPMADEFPDKEKVSEEIVQVSQNAHVECHPPEVSSNSECQESEKKVEEILNKEVSESSHREPDSSAFDLGGGVSISVTTEPSKDNEDAQNETNSADKEAESPSPASESIDDSTAEKSNDSNTNASSVSVEIPSPEVPQTHSVTEVSVPSDLSVVVNPAQSILPEPSESSQATESTESPCLNGESNDNANDDTGEMQEADLSSTETETITQTAGKVKPAPTSTESAGDEAAREPKKESENGEDELPVNHLGENPADVKEDGIDTPTDPDREKEEKEAETSFISLPANGDGPEPVTNGQWTPQELDIQLDDSAIEMDKESPLADTTPSADQAGSRVDQAGSRVDQSKEDDGVGSGSDNSSDCNDGSKSGPNATIDAYLKLQRPEVEDVRQVSGVNGTGVNEYQLKAGGKACDRLPSCPGGDLVSPVTLNATETKRISGYMGH